MKQFKIAEPQTFEHVTSLSPEDRTYCLMAGGTDLVGELKDGIIEPEIIIDLNSTWRAVFCSYCAAYADASCRKSMNFCTCS